MTAIQIINEIKTMKREEREQITAYLRQIEAEQGCVDDQQAEAASDRILDRHAQLMRKLAS